MGIRLDLVDTLQYLYTLINYTHDHRQDDHGIALLAVRSWAMRESIRRLASAAKRVRLLALASTVGAVTVLSGGGVAGADVAGAHSDEYRQIANLTGPNIPFFKAPPGSLVPDIVFVDPALHRVYLSDQSNVKPGTGGHVIGAVDAWNTQTFKFAGAMFGGFTGLTGFPASFDTEGPDGVLADNLGHIWAGNGVGTVMVGDARTMKEIKVIKTGIKGRADELAYDPVNHTILVTEPGGSPPGWILIDAKTFRILGRGTLGPGIPAGSIEQPQFDPLLGKFVSSISQMSSHDTHGGLAVVDTQVMPNSHIVPAKGFRLSVACNPLGLTVGPSPHVFLGCLNGGPVIAAANRGGTGFTVTKQFKQACCSDEVWYDPHLGRYYAASFLNPGGTGKDPVVTVVNAKTGSFITNIPIFTDNLAPNGGVAPEPDMSFHSVSADPATGYVYVPTATGIRVFAAAGSPVPVPPTHTAVPVRTPQHHSLQRTQGSSGLSGWLYLVIAAGIVALGFAVFEVGRRRRKGHGTA
jgi:hypothetical protein